MVVMQSSNKRSSTCLAAQSNSPVNRLVDILVIDCINHLAHGTCRVYPHEQGPNVHQRLFGDWSPSRAGILPAILCKDTTNQLIQQSNWPSHARILPTALSRA